MATVAKGKRGEMTRAELKVFRKVRPGYWTPLQGGDLAVARYLTQRMLLRECSETPRHFCLGSRAYAMGLDDLRTARPKAKIPGSTPGSRSVGRERAEPDTSTYEGRFAARLGALVNKRGIDPRDLAKTLGVNQAAVYAWLAGRKTPAVEKFPAIAAALGVKKPGDILPLE